MIHLCQPVGEIYRSSLSLLRVASERRTVGIATGFSISGPSETDGPPGAVSLARALSSAGCTPFFVTDEANRAHMERVNSAGFEVVVWPQGEGEVSTRFAAALMDRLKPGHLVAIERAGRAVNGRYYRMVGKDITEFCGQIDDLFLEAARRGVETTGIGDGGNEVGMGKAIEAVKRHIPHGPIIACATPTDNLIVAGVSNWGGYALACAVLAAKGERGLIAEGGPTVARERATLALSLEAGAIDGVLGRVEMSVDGMPFDIDHARLIDDLNAELDNFFSGGTELT